MGLKMTRITKNLDTVSSEILISETAIRIWRQRWSALLEKKISNDYMMAALLAEVRAVFPAGMSGDLQFRNFVKKYFGTFSSKSLLEKSKGYAEFSEQEWTRYGGWSGISFLLALSGSQRSKVTRSLTEYASGPFSYASVRSAALKLGIVSKRAGRSTRSKTEERIYVLQSFLIDLYKRRKDLPPLPEEVKQALTKSVLAVVRDSLAA